MTIDQLPSPVSQTDFINGAQFDYQYFKKKLTLMFMKAFHSTRINWLKLLVKGKC